MSPPPLAAPKELISATDIARRVRELGQALTADLAGAEPVFVCVLKGAAFFHADLVREIHLPLVIDFVAVSSYGASTESSGEVRLTKDLDASVGGRDVILVEDIVDSGLTLRYLRRVLENRDVSSLRVCSLLSKPARRKVDVGIDYLGFEIDDQFVVGYGLDYNQHYRNLPYLGVLPKEDS